MTYNVKKYVIRDHVLLALGQVFNHVSARRLKSPVLVQVQSSNVGIFVGNFTHVGIMLVIQFVILARVLLVLFLWKDTAPVENRLFNFPALKPLLHVEILVGSFLHVGVTTVLKDVTGESVLLVFK